MTVRLSLVTFALLLGSCTSGPTRPPANWRPASAERVPVPERRRSYYDDAASELRREWHVLLHEGGKTVAHGRDSEWYPGGLVRSERFFDHGEPTGKWMTAWPDGSPRSECSFCDPPRPSPMRWWHANGVLSTEGMALNGVRRGTWTSYHANGAKSMQGDYEGGLRQGVWSFWNADGELVERGEFRAGVRVGDWKSFSTRRDRPSPAKR
jgi:hypothetical protein